MESYLRRRPRREQRERRGRTVQPTSGRGVNPACRIQRESFQLGTTTEGWRTGCNVSGPLGAIGSAATLPVRPGKQGMKTRWTAQESHWSAPSAGQTPTSVARKNILLHCCIRWNTRLGSLVARRTSSNPKARRPLSNTKLPQPVSDEPSRRHCRVCRRHRQRWSTTRCPESTLSNPKNHSGYRRSQKMQYSLGL